MQLTVIPDKVVQAISHSELPCFVFDSAAVKHRAGLAASLVERCFFPLKACPEQVIARAALAAGCGLDLCSAGDAQIASEVDCTGEHCKFTSAHADESLLRSLSQKSARLDADSLEQALAWGACGGTSCGLRIRAAQPNALYGAKFGLPAGELPAAARQLAEVGVRVEGLHLHDQHANLTPPEFARRLGEIFRQVDGGILHHCLYVNIGGSWPMRHGNPASIEDLRIAFNMVREHLAALGFKGAVQAEPGRWIVGPCGYWAAHVAAVKAHPMGGEHRVVILDTNTPVPCRPSLSPFAVLRGGKLLQDKRTVTCDVFGSANTALDIIGSNVRLPSIYPGDVIVSLGQGAYTRSLISSFNERERPGAVVVQG